jgi:hypothetical protein
LKNSFFLNTFFVYTVQCTLDVHAIDELKQSKGLKLTDDLPKYDYESDEEGKYGKKINEYFGFISFLFCFQFSYQFKQRF